MAFNHRKLISDSSTRKLSEVCESVCHLTREPDDYCPKLCISWCPQICHPPPPPPPPTTTTTTSSDHQNKNPVLRLILIASLSILATTCFLYCCYTIFKSYKNWAESRRRRRRLPRPQQEMTHDEFLDEDHGPVLIHPIWFIRTVGLQQSVIDSITVCKYKRGDGLVEGTECSVCLNEFQEDETLRLLPKCNHAFHIPCIDTWLRSHTNCPLCRAGIAANVAGIPTPTPTPEQSVDNPVVSEENQVVVSESSSEFRWEREGGDCESRMGSEEESEREVENGRKSPEISKEGVDEPKRRSVSLDSFSASMISAAIANAHPGEIAGNSDSQLGKLKESDTGIVPKRVDVNQSLLRVAGGSSMKRSLSCSGKVLLSRYARSRNSVLPS